jgi:hypothetical protein
MLVSGKGPAARPIVQERPADPPWLKTTLRTIFVVCLGLALRGLTGGWDKPILDVHGFRQTQTAAGVQSMIDRGSWLRYETPVFGPPWSVPFEFPLYQWVVALLYRITGIPLDQSGRCISAAFFLASVGVAHRILAQLGIRNHHRLAVLALLLASPLYIFWSRTFLIESTALFLALAYLSFVLRALERPSPGTLIATAMMGALAATVKVTTFWGFLFVAVLFALRRVRMLHAARGGWTFVREQSFLLAAGAFVVAFVAVPTIAVAAWTHFTDSLKQANPLAAGFIDSGSLAAWNFGDLSQRLSARLWDNTVTGTQVTDVLGNRIFLPLLLIAACFPSARRAWIWGALGAFVLDPLSFTNLHIVHNYYAYANGVFLLAAVGFVLVDWLARGGAAALLAVAALIALIGTQQIEYGRAHGYSDQQVNARAQLPTLFEKMRDLVPRNDVILVYGLDWDPSAAYYSEHRLIMDRANRPLHQPPISESLRILRESGQTVGGMVNCKLVWNAPGPYHPPDVEGVIRTFALSAAPAFDDGACQLHVAAP